jgi:hypothetical protein
MPRLLKLKNRSWKNFGIAQAEPKPKKAGVGPYALYFDGREIVRLLRERDCRDYLEKLVQEKWTLDAKIRQLTVDFCTRQKLPRYPEGI